jgi:hypothetical protein
MTRLPMMGNQLTYPMMICLSNMGELKKGGTSGGTSSWKQAPESLLLYGEQN